MLSRIFGPKITGEYRRLRDKELSGVHLSPNIRAIKSRRVRWTGHVARMVKRIGIYRDFVGRREGSNHLKDPGTDGRISLKWIFKKLDVGSWTGLIWLRIGTGGGLL